MSAQPRPLRVLSLNCWGLKFVADKRRERLLAIADWIATHSNPLSSSSSRNDDDDEERAFAASVSPGDSLAFQSYSQGGPYDVIALQEIWVRADFDVATRFPFSGAIGSGLAILSAHPIVSSFITPYALNGYPLHFIAGDFFAGKSICGCTIDLGADVGSTRLVDVLNTHMFAPGGEGDGIDGAHRVAQAWQLNEVVKEKLERGRHVLLVSPKTDESSSHFRGHFLISGARSPLQMGDFNSQPYSIIMRILESGASLSDAWALTNQAPPSITSIAHRKLTPVQTMLVHGITCDSPLNTYSAAKLAKRHPRDETRIRGGKRLDYILFRSPPTASSKLQVESTKIVLTEPVPGLGVSYSDHFGLAATFSFQPQTPTTEHVSHSNQGSRGSISSEDLSTMLKNLMMAYRHALECQKRQFQLFVLALFLVPVLAIAASYQPLRGALSWLFVVLGTAVGASGATMLYTGFVGGNWERGALRNVIADIEAEMERRDGDGQVRR
ncbi:BZ3500_MvSof-1268-A1-R1_Chr3-1g05849 [Microbotryum saponariae]|uniref:BZ3500_MvSof-1268-A1-R1_Chr3-1g05849 protein n=1 Tax=Microbotryum saponariae TaxID=289078 RepID=A0A2X0N1W1_9BASI|nr:BZ3500_MvSof-1268-A1-R1_Chr3-1g05849 [Microbotryum saponariae]SDA05039.1 BZ3501_MvSof-1269-A2-R1_Chr3-1g05519 [Microbotryum saponariae]